MVDEEKKDVEVEVKDEKVEVVEAQEDVKEETVEVEVKDEVVDEKKEEATIIEADKSDDSLVIEVADEKKADEPVSKKDKKKKNKKDKKADAVVEVENIPTEVVSTKEQKKGKKVASFFAFSTIILALIFTIVDWTVESVTKDHNPQIVLHLMDWISIILYLTIAVKALPFLANKKKWVKVMFWICVIGTLVCILVPMVLDYVDLAKAIEATQEEEAAKQAMRLLIA